MSRLTTSGGARGGGIEVVLRGYDSERDAGLVFDSWTKSAKGTESRRREARIPWPIWSRMQREHVARCLGRASCVVLALPDAPDEIVGWCCAEERAGRLVVHWIYVVRTLRRLGAALAMLDWLGGYLCRSTFRELVARSKVADGVPVDPHVFATQWPRAKWIGDKLPGLGFDPYLVANYGAAA